MIDTFSILFSTVMVVLILVRAVKLDRSLPWFPALSRTGPASPPPARGSARPGWPGPEAGEAPAAAPKPPARGASRPGGGAGAPPTRVRTLPGAPPPRRAGR